VDEAADEESEADDELCCCIAIRVIRIWPLMAPCVLPVMPVPETADVDEALDAVSFDVSDDEEDEEELLVRDDSSEASIWLALLAADIARLCNMAVSKEWWLERAPEFFWLLMPSEHYAAVMPLLPRGEPSKNRLNETLPRKTWLQIRKDLHCAAKSADAQN